MSQLVYEHEAFLMLLFYTHTRLSYPTHFFHKEGHVNGNTHHITFWDYFFITEHNWRFTQCVVLIVLRG